jgi:hypothetical protein
MALNEIPRADRNPKAHDLALIRGSIETFGATIAGVLDERTGRLVAGHGRLAVLAEMRDAGASPPEGVQLAGEVWQVPIVRGWSSRSDAEAEAYVVADNRTGEKGGWDDRLLAEVLDDIADDSPDLLEATGYTGQELEDLLGSFSAPPDLDALEKEYGEPGEDDLWPVIRVKVPPGIREDFYDLTDGEDDTARFIAMVTRVKAAQ